MQSLVWRLIHMCRYNNINDPKFSDLLKVARDISCEDYGITPARAAAMARQIYRFEVLKGH